MKANEMKAILAEFRSMGLNKERVRERLNKEVKLNPEEVTNYVRLSLYFLSINDLEEAMVNIKKALIYEPGDENLWFLKGEIFEQTKYYKYAFESYYYAYRLGSHIAQKKILAFCEGDWSSKLDLKRRKMLENFKETVC